MTSVNLRKPFGLRDAVIFELTDTTPTYDTGVDIPCVSELSIDPQIVSARLEGDDSICASHSNLESINITITHGGAALDVYEVLFGSTLTDSGTGATEGSYLDLKVSDIRPYMGVAADSRGSEGGNTLFCFYKCKSSGGGGGSLSKGSFYTPAFNFECIVSDYDADTIARWWNYSTAVAISTTWTSNYFNI